MIFKAFKVVVAIALCDLSAGVLLTAKANPAVPPEYVIKAAYIYNFAMFVEWPADAFSRDDSPVVIGIIGTDPFGSALEEIVRDKKVSRKRFIIKRFQSYQDVKDCHILFFNSAETARLSEIVQQLKRAPVLLVGEAPEFARRGGMINFTVEDNKVRCEINVTAARRARLAISSQLLSLAKVIEVP
jgi:YfiR/HmsC-like